MKLKIIGILLLISTVFGLCQEKKIKEPESSEIELLPETPEKKLKSEENIKPSSTYFEPTLLGIPKDLKILIALAISSSINFNDPNDIPTPQKAIQSLKLLIRVDPKLKNLLNDPTFTQAFLEKLADHFHKSVLELAPLMNTPVSRQIAKNLKELSLKILCEFEETNPEEKSPGPTHGRFGLLDFTNFDLFVLERTANNRYQAASVIYYALGPDRDDTFSDINWSLMVAERIADNKLELFKLWLDSGIICSDSELWKNAIILGSPEAIQLLIECHHPNFEFSLEDYDTEHIQSHLPLDYSPDESKIFSLLDYTNLLLQYSPDSEYKEKLEKIKALLLKAGAKTSEYLQLSKDLEL